MEKIRIGISACLLGQNVRYDGGHQHDRYITDTLGRWFEWVPVCPEVEYGLPVPREAMRLVGNPESPRLLTIRSRIDHTDGMRAWAENRLTELAAVDLCGFIFKSRSPSSGMAAVKVYPETGMAVKKGIGIFAGAFMKRFPLLPVEEDGRLNDPALRENFNVLEHMAGYFKKRLSPAEKQELQEVIGLYHGGLLPLIVPVTLIAHYVRLYDEPYLRRQIYLHPHPVELMLRNHG